MGITIFNTLPTNGEEDGYAINCEIIYRTNAIFVLERKQKFWVEVYKTFRK